MYGKTIMHDILMRQRVRDLLWNADSLLNDEYLEKKNKSMDSHPLQGHCYVASECLYHLSGGAEGPYKPMFVRHEGEPHWFLENRTTGDVVDLTGEQFDSPVPYEKGIGKGFLTKEPSRRAKIVIDRIVGESV